ncbi:MAG: hypothetical protein U0270_33845 [Labilithrix sp.]
MLVVGADATPADAGSSSVDGSVTDSGATPRDGGADDGDVGLPPDGGCAAPKEQCAEGCINTRISETNCGRCGNACGAGVNCLDGRCENEIVDVALGDGHSCAALGNGDVWCWGSNVRGQAGVPIAAPAIPPTKVAITDVLRLGAAYDSMCAVKKDNTVWCWGFNNGGALGHPVGGGSPVDIDCPDAGTGKCNSTPQKVPELIGAAEVMTGSATSCARTLTATVSCWGTASCGSLGTPDAGSSLVPVPREVTGVANVKRLPSSNGQAKHYCVILNDDSLVCWGNNGSGQCGHAPEPEPPSCNGATGSVAPPSAVPGLGKVTSVAVNADGVTCATANQGKVYCWGNNSGALITPPSSTPPTFSTPTEVALGTAVKATKVVLGDAHACALLEDQTVRCWGSNNRGRLGIGNTTNALFPPSLALVKATNLWSGRGYSGALLPGGSLAMWGGNGAGQLAQAQDIGSNGTPTVVSGLP